MSPKLTNWPAVTGLPLSSSVPLVGSVVIFTREVVGRAVAGIAEAEVAGLEGVVGVFDRRDGLVSAAGGVVDRGDVDRDRVGVDCGFEVMPPLAVPPSSCNWKVKVVAGAPLWLSAEV